MRLWRLASSLYPPLTGEGARKRGGRWNSPGVPLVYGSHALSLAALEVLVGNEAGELPDNLMAWHVEVPDDSLEVLGSAPDAWFDDPYQRQSRRFGDVWAAEARSLTLQVPSAVIRVEHNLLLNPLHPRFADVQIVHEAPFRFGDRLAQ